jgi:hypothetical protein
MRVGWQAHMSYRTGLTKTTRQQPATSLRYCKR